MTITRRILFQIAIAAGLVILIASGVTYGLVYRTVEQQGLDHLRDYVAERARVEETRLLHVRENLETVRGIFLRRFSPPPPRDVQQQWDRWFELHPDGAWRSRREYADGRKWATVWVGKGAPLTVDIQTQILRAYNISNDFLPGWVDTFPSLYFVFPCQANVGFDPRIPNWVWDTPADYDNNAIEAVASANLANNPSRQIVWNGVIEEPVSKRPYIAVMLPIDVDGKNIANVGHDIDAWRLLDDSTRSSLPGVTHFVFSADGRLIAHRDKMPQIIVGKGRYTMQGSDDPSLRSLYKAATDSKTPLSTGYDETSGSYFGVSRLAGPGWFFLTTMPGSQLREKAFTSARWVLWSGFTSLALVLIFFAGILRRQIAQPLAELARATGQMSGGDATARAVVAGRDELGALAGSFNEMASRVSSRDAELRELNQQLEQQVESRTAELMESNQHLDQARKEAIGALAAERELNAMKNSFISMVSHEFRTPLGVILSATDVLDRYLDRLLPEERREHLDMIFRSVRNLTQLVENTLLLGKVEGGRLPFKPAPIDLSSLVHQLIDEIASATNARCPVECVVASDLAGVSADADLLRHIVTNLLSNAVKYSEPGSPVTITLERRQSDAVIEVRDRGIGIPEEDRRHLFSSFARAGNVGERPGTGLGLLIVKRCAELHGGSVAIDSSPGRGTTVTITLPLFALNP